jgi:hypothetical protein
MISERTELLGQPGGLIRLLSAPEGSSLWAAGMCHEIRVHTRQRKFDREYVSHCLSLLRRTSAWRHLRDASGRPFETFIHLCYAPGPKGLALTRSQVEALLVD